LKNEMDRSLKAAGRKYSNNKKGLK